MVWSDIFPITCGDDEQVNLFLAGLLDEVGKIHVKADHRTNRAKGCVDGFHFPITFLYHRELRAGDRDRLEIFEADFSLWGDKDEFVLGHLLLFV